VRGFLGAVVTFDCSRAFANARALVVGSTTIFRVSPTADAAVDYDKEAIPPFSNVAVESDTVRASGYEPTMPTSIQAHRLHRPPLLWIERNEHNGYALVTFDQLSFESHLIHSTCDATVRKRLKASPCL
jgi:hypothetical protein